jgi:hypothetical protein
MGDNIIKWKVFCSTENAYVTALTESIIYKPLRCPNNSNHIIIDNLTSMIEVIGNNQVIIKEENIPTQGFFRVEGKKIDCPMNSTSSQIVDLEYPVSILAFYISPESSNFNDNIDIYIEIGDIGVLTSEVNSGSSIIPLNTPNIDNLPIGFEILIDNIVIGEIIGKNSVNSALTLNKNTMQVFPVNSTVSLRNRMVKNFTIGKHTMYPLGLSKIGSSYISPSYFIMVEYTNKSLTENRQLIYHVEYTY